MQIGCAPVLPQPERRLQIIWVGPDVCRLLSITLGRKLGCLQAGARMNGASIAVPCVGRCSGYWRPACAQAYRLCSGTEGGLTIIRTLMKCFPSLFCWLSDLEGERGEILCEIARVVADLHRARKRIRESEEALKAERRTHAQAKRRRSSRTEEREKRIAAQGEA